MSLLVKQPFLTFL